MANTLTGKIPFNIVYRDTDNIPPYAYLEDTRISLYPGVYYPGTDLTVTVGSDIFLTRENTRAYFSEGYHRISVPTASREIRTITCGTSNNYVEYPLLVCDTGSVAGSWYMQTRATDTILKWSVASYSDCPEISRLIDASVSAFSAGTPVDIFGRDYYPQYTHSLLCGAVMAPRGSGNCADVYRYPQKGNLVLVSSGERANIMQKIYPQLANTENVLVVSAGSEYTMIYPTTVTFNDSGLYTTNTVTITTTATKYGLPISKQSHALTAWRHDRYLQISESAPEVTVTYTVNTPLSLVGVRSSRYEMNDFHADAWIYENIKIENGRLRYLERRYDKRCVGVPDGKNPLLNLATAQHKTGLESVVASYSFLGGGYVCLGPAYTFDTYPEVVPYRCEVASTDYSEYYDGVRGKSSTDLYVIDTRIVGNLKPPTCVIFPPAVLTACPPLAPKYSFNGTLGAVYGMPKYSMSITTLLSPSSCYLDVMTFEESNGVPRTWASYTTAIPDVALHIVPDLLDDFRMAETWYWSRADNHGGSSGLSPFSLYLSSDSAGSWSSPEWVGCRWSADSSLVNSRRLTGRVSCEANAVKVYTSSASWTYSGASERVMRYTYIEDTYYVYATYDNNLTTRQGKISSVHDYSSSNNSNITHTWGEYADYYTDVATTHYSYEQGTTGELTYFNVFATNIYSYSTVYRASRSVVSYVPAKVCSNITSVRIHNTQTFTLYSVPGPGYSSAEITSTHRLEPVSFTVIRQMPTGAGIPSSFTLENEFKSRLNELRISLAQAERDKKSEISAAISIEEDFTVGGYYEYTGTAERRSIAQLDGHIYLGSFFQ